MEKSLGLDTSRCDHSGARKHEAHLRSLILNDRQWKQRRETLCTEANLTRASQLEVSIAYR